MNPFTPSDTYKDSSMFRDNIVEHTTSWLTINPFKGCSLKCGYCFRVKWGATDRPIPIFDVSLAVEKLIEHPDFIANITPISINISSTDALLPKVKESTFKALEIFESKKLKNPFGITTKLGFSLKEIHFIESLQYVRPIIFISLAFIPREIEPVPIIPRIRNLKLLSKTAIPTVLYYRPIVENWNDSDEIIETVLKIGNKYADALCIGSLRLSKEIRQELVNLGLDTNGLKDDFHLKEFQNNVEKRILDKYKLLKIKLPLFKHTSCAVSYLMGIPNYNMLYTNELKHCMETCPTKQQKLCKSNFA